MMSEKSFATDVRHVTSKDARVLEVLNANYALALSTGPQLSPYSRRSLQLFAILLVSFMGSLSNGFDGSGMYLKSHEHLSILDRRVVFSNECRQWHGVRDFTIG